MYCGRGGFGLHTYYTRDVVNEIQKRSYLSFDDTVDASATYTTLQNTENALWTEPAGYIANMYFVEKKQTWCA